LAALLAVVMVVLFAATSESLLARRIVTDALTPERVLPLIGLGAAFALIDARSLRAGLLLFALGIASGVWAEDALLRILDILPHAATHLFFAVPIAYLAIGIALAAGGRLCSWIAPIAAMIVGAMLALVIQLTDPSLHDPTYIWAPLLMFCWIVAAVSLTLRFFRHDAFPIFGRILGSWLLAIGLLYGAASLLPKRQPPPDITMPENAPSPSFDGAISGQPEPVQPRPLPGEVEPPQ
jgi:hypothetical protein